MSLQMMRNLLSGSFHGLSKSFGYTAYKTNVLPFGVDWVWDLKRITKPGDIEVIYDVGANVGDTAISMLERFPDALMHCFEPTPPTYQSLKVNLARLGKVATHQLAISSELGKSLVSHNPDYPDTNRLIGVPNSVEAIGAETFEVSTATIDSLCVRPEFPNPHLIKTDTEGHDLAVLQGAANTLKDCIAVLSEVELGRSAERPRISSFTEIDQFLKARGFAVFAFYDYGYKGIEMIHANALWIKTHDS